MIRSDFDATNRHQFSTVCTLIDHRNDFNMFKLKWKTTGDWFHCKINLDLSSGAILLAILDQVLANWRRGFKQYTLLVLIFALRDFGCKKAYLSQQG